MIAKKNLGVDLERRRTALFSMGLLIAGSFTLAAFTYGTSVEELDADKKKQRHADITYMLQDAPKEEKEPIKTDVETPDKDENQTEPTIDLDKLPDDKSEASENTDKKIESKVGSGDVDMKIGSGNMDLGDLDVEIFDWVDIEAHFVGGIPAMNAYMQSNVIYPQEALELGIQGRVFVSFVVEKDGSISNVQIEQTDDKIFDREAKRIVRSFPTWVPAEIQAKAVRTRFRLPIVFTLD